MNFSLENISVDNFRNNITSLINETTPSSLRKIKTKPKLTLKAPQNENKEIEKDDKAIVQYEIDDTSDYMFSNSSSDQEFYKLYSYKPQQYQLNEIKSQFNDNFDYNNEILLILKLIYNFYYGIFIISISCSLK